MKVRDKTGRYSKQKKRVKPINNIIIDHNYLFTELCDGDQCKKSTCNSYEHLLSDVKGFSRSGWREGRRLIELDVLLKNLQLCQHCKLGPIPLTFYNIVGELQKGLSGYLYVVCQNPDCNEVNRVAYGKQHRLKARGMPCFDVNTKLGTAMIDSLGGPVKVNNFLATLNIKPIDNKNLKKMEARAGEAIQEISTKSSHTAAIEAFKKEMEEVSCQESEVVEDAMEGDFAGLGVCPLPDESPSFKQRLQAQPLIDGDSDSDADIKQASPNEVPLSTPKRKSSLQTAPVLSMPSKAKFHGIQKQKKTPSKGGDGKARMCLAKKYPCKTRTGISCAIDTAWQKKGFDCLTSHTFFMSKAKYGKKVLKTIVRHRTCGTCNWWRRNRPYVEVRPHFCVKNHSGSARSMESSSGAQGVLEMMEQGTPIEYLEGDGDNTLISRLKKNHQVNMKKRFDRNHVVKNFGKTLYAIHYEKKVKLSKLVIIHLEKCMKYAFTKNQGNLDAMRENLKAIVPHQFGDHSLCHVRYCGHKRKPGVKYVHKGLPYHVPLKDEALRGRLQKVFEPYIANAERYIDLGSSQQCEHANKEVSLRAPKSHHYGHSKSLDYRVHATAAFINEGRHYITETNKKLGLSPGQHTILYATMCQKRRLQKQEKQQLPSTKRRRLVLEKERATTQGAQEALEGTSYQSGVGHLSDVDVETLPEAVSRGNFKPLKLESDPVLVTFDLETTDLIRGTLMPDITQIAAMDMKTGSKFSIYVKPTVPISSEAQRVTGIFVDPNGNMSVNGDRVDSVSIKIAIHNFIQWLAKFPGAILVAHNGRRFDFSVLVTTLLKTYSLDKFCECVSGFVDSLPVFKKLYPGQSHKQEDLVKHVLQTTYSAHDALADVQALGSLLKTCPTSDIMAHSFTISAISNSVRFSKEKAKNIRSLDELIFEGIIKRPTAENIAGSGLALCHLKTILSRSGEDGLRDTFTAKNSDEQPRVTSAKKILNEVVPKIAQFLSNVK